MRPDIYDTIIDTIREFCGYGVWYGLSVAITGIVLGVIYIIIVEWFDVPISVIYFVIIDVVISFFITVFMYMMEKASERFNTRKWRDFWMAFGHPVVITFVKDQRYELNQWLNNNVPRLYRTILVDIHKKKLTIVFKNRKDAVACKLRWS